MKTFLKNIKNLNIYLKIIVLFCLYGFFKDLYLLSSQGGDVAAGYRLYGGFALVFGSQAVFILLRDWRAAIFSAAQCFFAIMLYEDFTFTPVIKPLFRGFMYITPGLNYNKIYFLQYVMVSFLFSLELLKTFIIFDYLKPKNEKKESSS